MIDLYFFYSTLSTYLIIFLECYLSFYQYIKKNGKLVELENGTLTNNLKLYKIINYLEDGPWFKFLDLE